MYGFEPSLKYELQKGDFRTNVFREEYILMHCQDSNGVFLARESSLFQRITISSDAKQKIHRPAKAPAPAKAAAPPPRAPGMPTALSLPPGMPRNDALPPFQVAGTVARLDGVGLRFLPTAPAA